MVADSSPVDAGRRRLITGAAAACALTLLPALPAPAADFWSQPRRLRLVRPRTGERLDAIYWRNGAPDPVGYAQVCHLMRDVRGGKTVSMHPRLLDLLCAIQAWVAAYGYTQAMEILSGYRSPETNANTEGAARNSMHMYGQAADIVLPGLPVSYMGQLAQRYAGGGVGFYASSGFVHVDTGRIRTWGNSGRKAR